MDFDAFVREIEANGWPVHGVELYENGQLTHMHGDTTAHRYPIYSATKTITAIGAGMAADDGKLSLGDSILRYLPGEVLRGMSAAQQAAYRHVTLERLMTMSVSGYPFRPEGESWLRSVLALPLEQVETPRFDYSNVSAYLTGVTVTCALGEDLGAYLTRRLFLPLGIEQPPFSRCPDGYFYGASNMSLTVNELSRVGLLLAESGVYRGQRIVSEAFVRAATSLRQMNREGGYGYLIWKYRDGFSINGKWGQKCFVLPREGKMVTYLAHMEHGSEAIRACMEAHLLDIDEK